MFQIIDLILYSKKQAFFTCGSKDREAGDRQGPDTDLVILFGLLTLPVPMNLGIQSPDFSVIGHP